jgi:hypothetical protein
MNAINPHKTGLAVGILIGGWHLLWAILIAVGLGQLLLDFVLWAHMLHLPVTVGPFDAVAVGTLIVVTSVTGYAIGYLFAWAWNKLHAQ